MTGSNDLVLAIDIGTGSARSGAVDEHGRVSALHATPLETFHPRHGWVEQKPEDWWTAICMSIRTTLATLGPRADRLRAVTACGHMHAPVLLDHAGALVTDRAMLWNDKRAANVAARFAHQGLEFTAGNPPTPAWPGPKLVWLKENTPQILERTAAIMMPKDYVNFRLTGEIAMDRSEAGSSFLMDAASRTWSDRLVGALGLPGGILPHLGDSHDTVGRVTATAAAATGLRAGLPVFLGAGDYPAAVLGSGVSRPGEASDITGTSYLLTEITEAPIVHDDVMNVCTPDGHWGSFAVVDAAGDAIRWSRQMFEKDQTGYAEMAEAAGRATPGGGGLMFLPYLTGERLGQGPESRAAFLGLTARHRPADAHRAIMEGVALAMRDAAEPLWQKLPRPSQIIAAAGGARTRTWLEIKANVLGVPHVPTEEPECGLLGCSAIARTGVGDYASVDEAAKAMVRYLPAVHPDPDKMAFYRDLSDVFGAARAALKNLNEKLGRIDRS
ncbi:MAG: pentose kinase [Maritimibacter sp.]|nr:pentose kinase [Maritimibacter sp.]